jgi:hypothetical protein
VVRHFVAVKDGVVVGSRSTRRPYQYAMLHRGAAGWFATFHQDRRGAQRALRFFVGCRQKELVLTVETDERMPVGRVWE